MPHILCSRPPFVPVFSPPEEEGGVNLSSTTATEGVVAGRSVVVAASGTCSVVEDTATPRCVGLEVVVVCSTCSRPLSSGRVVVVVEAAVDE